MYAEDIKITTFSEQKFIGRIRVNVDLKQFSGTLSAIFFITPLHKKLKIFQKNRKE